MTTVTLFDKSKLPSRHATVGPDRAPHRYKNARIAWALMIRNETFQAGYLPKARGA
jgi:hypothetical protein